MEFHRNKDQDQMLENRWPAGPSQAPSRGKKGIKLKLEVTGRDGIFCVEKQLSGLFLHSLGKETMIMDNFFGICSGCNGRQQLISFIL